MFVTVQTVSVVMPTNRGGPYIQDALASVSAQTVPALEVILVDDGSPDPGLGKVAEQLGARFIRQNPSGISVARNAGVAAAKGAWIAFLDDDDVWHRDRLSAQLEALADRPGAIAGYTGGWYMDSEGREFGDGWAAPPARASEILAARVPAPRITTLLVRQDAYLAVGGCRSDMEPAEDNELILRLLQRGEFVAVDRQLVGYRRHAANVTRRGLAGRIANERSILGQLEDSRAAADAETLSLLTDHLESFRLNAAAENLGDLITAVRQHEWGYAWQVMWWGARMPIRSMRAVIDRLRHRSRA